MDSSSTDRRTILGAGVLAVGVGALATHASAEPARETRLARWEPAAETQDAWLDVPHVRHRMAFDTTTAGEAAGGMNYAANYYEANKLGYDLDPQDLAVVMILRARSTPFAYTDSVWAKYFKVFNGFMNLDADMAERGKTTNPLFTGGAAELPGAPHRTLAQLHRKGTIFAVCGMATTGIAGMIAQANGKQADAVEAELKANLIPGARIVPAGIVAVNRVQEHGYAISYVA